MMKIKQGYRAFLKALKYVPYKVDNVKYWIAEWRAIILKRDIYHNVKWSRDEQKQFDDYWKSAIGRKIPSMWHKLYQASSGKFSVNYMPEYLYTTKIEPRMNDLLYSSVVEDKNFVELLSYNSKCVVPETIVVCSNGRFYNSNRRIIDKKEAINLILKNKNMIFKPATGSSSGKGIKTFHQLDYNNVESVILEYGKDFIVQKIIAQHSRFSKLNPSSVNTIRITTYILDEKIYHMPLCLRIGREGSSVDNIHAGGLVIGVNDDGELLPEGYQLGYGNCTKKYRKHPDTNVIFEKYRLPYIKDIIETAYMLHGRYLHVGIISWDFAINDKNEVVFIEANIRGQSVWICQMIHGKGAFEEQTKDILKLIK